MVRPRIGFFSDWTRVRRMDSREAQECMDLDCFTETCCIKRSIGSALTNSFCTAANFNPGYGSF